jgi:hypothetical protein
MTGSNDQRREKNYIVYQKGDERYVFVYDDAGMQDTLRTLGKFASDPSLSFSWFDAATLSQKIRQMKDQETFKCKGR